MIEVTATLVDVILNIAVVIYAARWADQRTERVWAIAFGCAIGAVYSVISDYSIDYLIPNYDHSINAVTLNALLGVPIDAAIAFVATRRRLALAQSSAEAKA